MQSELELEQERDTDTAAIAEQIEADEFGADNLTPAQTSYLNSPAPGLLTKPCPFCAAEYLSTSTRSAHIRRVHPDRWQAELSKVSPGTRIQWGRIALARRRVGRPMTEDEVANLAPSRRPKTRRKKPGPKKGQPARPRPKQPKQPAPVDSLARQTQALQQISDALAPLTLDEADRVLIFVQDTRGLFEQLFGKSKNKLLS